MNKSRKMVIVMLLLIAILFNVQSVVKASEGDKATFALTTSNTNVKVGDTVSVNLVISSISGFNGIRVFRALKSFDSSIFQYVSTEGVNGWELKADASRIVLETTNDQKSGTIAVMKFKVIKEVGNTTIQLKELDAASKDDNHDVYFEDGNVNSPAVSFTVTVANTPEPSKAPNTTSTPEPSKTPITTNTPTPTPTPTPTKTPDDFLDGSAGDATPTPNLPTVSSKPNSTNTAKPSNEINSTPKTVSTVKNDKTVAKGNMVPQTGESYIALAGVVVAIIICAIVTIRYIKFNKNLK